MSYTAIIKLEGETDIKVCFNPEPKPTNRDTDVMYGGFFTKLEYWQSKHQFISFYTEEDRIKTHVRTLDKSNMTIERFYDNLKQGIEADCIKIITGKWKKEYAVFSLPKETTVSEERLYTKQDMLKFLDHVAGIYKPVSQSGEIIYWTKSYNDKKDTRFSTKDLIKEFCLSTLRNTKEPEIVKDEKNYVRRKLYKILLSDCERKDTEISLLKKEIEELKEENLNLQTVFSSITKYKDNG